MYLFFIWLSGTTIHYITALGLECNISAKRAISLQMVVWKVKDAERGYMTEWNHKHGRNLVVYGCMLFVTGTVFLYFLERLESVTLELVVFFAVILAEVAWLEIQHISMKKKMIKH